MTATVTGPAPALSLPPAADAAMMALCVLSYTDNPLPGPSLGTRLARGLAQQDPLDGKWALAWGPGVTHANFAFAARNVDTGEVAVVARGSDFHILLDWFEDLDVATRAPFPYVEDAAARIAEGTHVAMNEVLSMVGPAAVRGQPPGKALTLLQFLYAESLAASGPVPVTFTGHSLGGALASVLAPWAAFQSRGWADPLRVRCCTFAAPTAGNGPFARATAPLYANGAGFARYYRTYDMVPRAWDRVKTIPSIFPGGPATPLDLKVLVDALGGLIEALDYQQPTAGWELPFEVIPGKSFWQEVSTQHCAEGYLSDMLGRPVERVVPLPSPPRVLRPEAPAATPQQRPA